MIRRPPRSTLFPTRRSSDLHRRENDRGALVRNSGNGVTGGDCGYFDRGGDCFGARQTRAGRELARPRLVRKQFRRRDRKSTRLNSSHPSISYAVFCLKKKKK